MALRRTLSTRGASVLAALVFAGILTAMAGLMSGIGPREPVVATSQGAQAVAATAPGASAKGAGQATDIEQTCKIGEDYDITSKDGKPAVVAYTPCPVGNNTRPPPDIPKTEGINTHNFGKCINPRPADYAKNVWTCAVRDCFKAPINSAMNGSISGGSNTIYCRFTTLEIGAAANAKSVREKTIVGTKEISSAAQQQALKNDGIVSTTIDSGAQNGITGEPSSEQQSNKEALEVKIKNDAEELEKLKSDVCGTQSTSGCQKRDDKVKEQEKKLNVDKAALDKLNADTTGTGNASNVGDDIKSKQLAVDAADDELQTCLQQSKNNLNACQQENKQLADADQALCKAGDTVVCKELAASKDVPEECQDPAFKQAHMEACSPSSPPPRDRNHPDTGFGDGQNCSQSDKDSCARKPDNNPSCQRCSTGGNGFGGPGQGGKSGGGDKKGGGSGKQQPQQPQCQPQYTCQGNAIYNTSPQTQCRPQLYQQCPGNYTCTGNSCVQSPYGTGTDGQPCQQPPAQPSARKCTVGSWQPTRAPNTCQTGWQCVGTTTPPTNPTKPPTPPPPSPPVSAQLSCQPKTVEPGMPISLSWSCSNATHSVGTGFSTGNILASSTSVTAPLLGLGLSTTTIFGLSCTDAQSNAATAQCTVQTTTPWITFITVPKSVQRGATATLGWITGGMSRCVISSHDYSNFTSQNAQNTSPNGSVQTPSIDPSLSNVFWLTCTSGSGSIKEASTTITVL